MKDKIILFRTCKLDHTSNYGKFKWNEVSEITEAPDWDANPSIDCRRGLHAEGEGCWGGYLDYENCILQILEVDKQDAVKSSSGDKWRFKKAKTLEEYIIDENTDYAKLWKIICQYGIESLMYFAGRDWQEITNEMRVEAFQELKNDKWIYWAGYYWKGVTDEMRVKAFEKLKEDEWIYWAGYIWKGVTNEMRKEKYKEIKNDLWKNKAKNYWEMQIKRNKK